MISIPYWWDQSQSSLEATLWKYRTDLFLDQPIGNPIPETLSAILPNKHARKQLTPEQAAFKENIEQQIMLSTNWSIEDDPTEW